MSHVVSSGQVSFDTALGRSKQIAKKGFSMIELIIVIAVIGVLTAVVLNQSQKMRESSNISRESSNIGMLTTAVQSTFNSQGNYLNLGAPPTSNAMIRSTNAFPASMEAAANDNFIQTAWQTDGVDINQSNTFGNIAGDSFTLTYKGVPQTSCADFVSQNYTSFFKVEVNTTVVRDVSRAAGAAKDEGNTPAIITACQAFTDGQPIVFHSR